METHTELNEKFLEFTPALNPKRFSLAWMKLLLVLADLCGMIVSIWLALGFFEILGLWQGSGYFILEPLVLVFGGANIIVGLFRSRNVNQVEELRQLTITTTMIFLILYSFNEVMGESKYPAAILALSWLFAVGAVPLARITVRWLGSSLGIWGEPVVIVGNGRLSRKLVHFLLKNSYCGLRPVLVVDGLAQDPAEPAVKDCPIPIVMLEELPSVSEIGSQVGVSTAIIVAPDLPSSMSESIARGEHLGFSNIITVTKQFNTRNFGLTPLDFGGVLGFEERHYELNVFEDRLIRIFDLFLLFFSLPILAPLFLCIMTAIRLDSAGSVFYRQTRIGKKGRTFKVLKFRTMVKDADKVLAKYLEENPEMLAEWNADHKLKDDPRITRVGKILRKTSLDELPQLWNVFRSEMSLVGPRPIVDDEVVRYGDRFKYYAQVPPGISGLWQVSGRNDIGYEERVLLDEYYVRNRSIWMNFHIIIRTILAVIQRHGAY